MHLHSLLTGGVAGALVMLCLLPSCLKEKICDPVTVYKDVVVTQVKVKTDTVEIPRFVNKTITMTIPVAKVIDTVNVDTTWVYRVAKKKYPEYFTRKLYTDSTEVEKGLKIAYDAEITGTLNGMKLRYKDSRPQVVVHDSTTIEKEVVRDHSNGFYVGIGISTALRSLSPHIMYQDRKGNSFRVGINALQAIQGKPELSFGYSRKLW